MLRVGLAETNLRQAMKFCIATFVLLSLGISHAWISNPLPSSRFSFQMSASGTTTEVIGAGRIGSFLAGAGSCRVLGRSDSIDPDAAGSPIIITTRNDALADIIEMCPSNRRGDLVFVQNGYLDPLLAKYDLLSNTQVLLYLSVTSLGAQAVDGVTTVNPEGLTTATGIHAQAFADRLQQLEMKCNVVDGTSYRPSMFEKLIWICTYMLVGTAKECKSVGQAGEDHPELIASVIEELMAAVVAKEGLSFESGTLERLKAYTVTVADFPCGVKEFEWRNQYFYDLGNAACPVHNGLLQECKAGGFLGFDLPK